MIVNNHYIHIENHGPQNGCPVVLLHHGLGSIQAWSEQIPSLSAAGFRVIVYDRWGYGRSEVRPYLAVPSFEDDLADLQAILEKFHISKVALIGHSDGGTIALYWAAQQPHQVSALVTVAAHIYVEPKMEPGIQQIREAFEQNPRFQKGMRRAHGSNYRSVFHNWYDGWHTPRALDWDMRPLLTQIVCPTLVIHGEQDEHATSQHARDIVDGILGAKLWLLPDANHMLPQEEPELFNKEVIKFLKCCTEN